eukprot:RCo032932
MAVVQKKGTPRNTLFHCLRFCSPFLYTVLRYFISFVPLLPPSHTHAFELPPPPLHLHLGFLLLFFCWCVGATSSPSPTSVLAPFQLFPSAHLPQGCAGLSLKHIVRSEVS